MEDNQIKIELKEDVAEGTYANLSIVTHSSSEFVLDFARMMPGVPKAVVKSRIILTPEQFKRLYRTLEQNLQQYEHRFGPITIYEDTLVPPISGVMGKA
jgi:hypothetical protein